MYDDASYYTFMPSVQSQEERPRKGKHRNNQSLLPPPPPNADNHADDGSIEVNGQTSKPKSKEFGPPTATLSRRSQSYSDFHDAVRAVLDKDKFKDEDRLHPKDQDEIKTELDFIDWYHDLEQDLLEASHADYTTYQSRLELSESHLDFLLAETTSTLDLLTSLSESFKNVEAQTTAFQKQCENLLQEQKRVSHLADGINENLRYYSYLEPATRRLNAPGAGSFVRSKEFSEMLARLDDCLEYMAAHHSHREATIYRSRYRLLLTRGLTLIRVHFVGALRDIASDVTRRIADRQLNDTTMSALLYAKFRVGASELKEVAQEIRKRIVLSAGAEAGQEPEYQSLMNELYTSYSTIRGKLVIPLVRKQIAEISMAPGTSKELVSFARSGTGFIKGICSDEYGLWHEWFEGEDGLYDFLESVCEPLYDHLRPRIIRENQLVKLCELCTLFQTRYMHDHDEEVEQVDTNQVDFSVLIHPALQDAQTRLVFRTQAILRDEIENFRPKPGDLDYPSRTRRVSLSGTKSQTPALSGRKDSVAEPLTPMPKTPMVVEESDSPNGRWGFDTEAVFEGWYPTLRKAIWLLSRIYRLVNSTVFDDLAHEIVHQTTVSLHQAAALIASKATPVDGQLFLIRHLLILKQQIVAFDIEYVTPDVSFDFSGVTNTFHELRERGSLFDPRSLWRVMGGRLLPKVVENMLDAKVELDGRLRTVINDFTTTAAMRFTSPITVSSSAPHTPPSQPLLALSRIRSTAPHEVSLLRHKLSEYLDDPRTRETLVGAVHDHVLHAYDRFHDAYSAERRSSGKAVRSKGKGRDDEVWDPDVFADWAAAVFEIEPESAAGDDNDHDRDHGFDEDGARHAPNSGPASPRSRSRSRSRTMSA